MSSVRKLHPAAMSLYFTVNDLEAIFARAKALGYLSCDDARRDCRREQRTPVKHREKTHEEQVMVFGAHVIVYSKDATADRAFFRDVLGFSSVDAGHDWLIFALPPAEVAVHPADENDGHELYFMCDALNAEMAALEEKNVRCSEVEEARWGSVTRIRLPGGGEIGLYQPKHPTAFIPASD